MRLLTQYIDPFLTSLGKVAFVIDERRVWQHLSPNWQQLTGFSVEDTLGTSADNFLSFADCPVIQKVVSDLIAGIRQQASYVARCATAKGDFRYVELDMAAQTAQDGEIVIVGLMRDVTERKQAEAALVRSEWRTQNIVDNIPSMVSCLSPDLRITFANTAYAADLGKRVDEVVGKSLFDLLHPSLHAVARGHLTSLSRHNPQCVFEHWVIRSNDEWRFQRWTDHVFFDEQGHVREYQTVGVDLTERKLAEDALRQSENKFRALVENITDIISTIDLDGNFTYISPSWEAVTGHAVDDFLGMTGMRLFHLEDVDTVTERMDKVLAGEQHNESFFYRIIHTDDVWHWHAGRGAPIVDGDGTVSGAVIVARDVTSVREHQLLLQSSLEQLEQSHNQNTMLMKEIHHRVKNNLQIVASLLNLQSHQLTDQQAKASLATSRTRIIAMAEIHTMMYQGDRADAVVFDAYLYALLERIRHAYDASSVTFTIDGDSFELLIDQAVPLALIVNELLTNAVKYAFPAPQENAHVTIGLVSNQTGITVIIEDNGVGIPPTVDLATTDSLGMTIVQSLTTQLEGTVTFEDRVEESGLRVVVNVPK